MSKKVLLPRLAFMSVRKNSITYLPYMAACIFSVFVYFVFDSILYNDIMEQLPKAGYAWMLLRIGFVLLGIILVPFLFYANSLLVKRRGKELGLYSLLGMEKKQIGMMMALETLYIYLLVLAAGILTGLVFSKLFFLLLLNMAGLPVDAAFTLQPAAIRESAIFWGIVSLLNLLVNLFQVGKARPVELMRKPKKGERDTRKGGLWLLAVLGVTALARGYYLSVSVPMDSMIFINFLGAILLVVIGTYLLFIWGSIVILRILKGNRRFFYQKEHFITVSGMYSRMKKSATSLVNICIFSTMVIITLVCTAVVWMGSPRMLAHFFPYDLELAFPTPEGAEQCREAWTQLAAAETEVTVEKLVAYRYLALSLAEQEGRFVNQAEEQYGHQEYISFRFIPLTDFNACAGTAYELTAEEVMIFTTEADYGRDSITLEDKKYQVKAELTELPMGKKFNDYQTFSGYYVIVPETENWSAGMGLWTPEKITIKSHISVLISGPEEARERFLGAAEGAARGISGDEASYLKGNEMRAELRAMNGGLSFLGIFFGIIFMICMVLVMYYKQISEGYEDKENFEIMQQVGMSEREVRRTIKKQIFMVFFIPLAMAVLHTAAGLPMTIKLLWAIQFRDLGLILGCGIGVLVVFSGLYFGCYALTARAYLRIVRKMA